MKGFLFLSFLIAGITLTKVYGQGMRGYSPGAPPPPYMRNAAPAQKAQAPEATQAQTQSQTQTPPVGQPPANIQLPQESAPASSMPIVENGNSYQPPEGFQNAEGYNYDPTGKRDPFKPYGQSQILLAPEPDDVQRPLEPLEMYDVSQFKLVGVIWNVRDPKAMVKDPSGKLHLVRKETRIGRNSGFVAAIREGEIIVVEPTVGENGMQTAITRVLTLKR